ncbi:Hypothetical protein D9617_68g041410 [Elsinoe fawcettii]|nr:Hypothetical protein D9617_68g041410 [Elsinoe fawcettii]
MACISTQGHAQNHPSTYALDSFMGYGLYGWSQGTASTEPAVTPVIPTCDTPSPRNILTDDDKARIRRIAAEYPKLTQDEIAGVVFVASFDARPQKLIKRLQSVSIPRLESSNLIDR